jgi:hypothetical protein
MSPSTSAAPSPTAAKATAAIVGILSLLILVQAFIGGSLANRSKTPTKGLINSHQGIGYVVLLLAVAAVVVAFVMWRGRAGAQVVIAESVALLVLVVIQIGIGQQLKKGTHYGLLAIHIPVALLIFGVALHLSTFVANLRRSGR